jgi:DNA replication protein DnaC
LKRQLHAQKITKDHFNLPWDEERLRDSLCVAYITEVYHRARQVVDEDVVFDNMQLVAKALKAPAAKNCIVLCGLCGNGKTTTMYAFQNLINLMRNKGEINKDFGFWIEDAKDLAISATNNYDTFKKICSKPLLGIEDMGREPAEILVYGNKVNPMIDLMERRYNEQRFTFITTNLTPQEISERYGKRVADRLNEIAKVVVFKNKSFRF